MERKTQLEELEVLKSIFYNDEIQVIEENSTDYIKIIFLAHLTLPENFSIKYRENLDSEEYSYVKVNYLPPLKLHLMLPEKYPSECPPKFTICCQWLTKPLINKLSQQLDKLWCENENTEIIYIWIDFLKNDLLEFLSITEELDLSELHVYYLKSQLCAKNKVRYKQSQEEPKFTNNETSIINMDVPYSELTHSTVDSTAKYSEQKVADFFNHRCNSPPIVARKSSYYNLKDRGSRFCDETQKIFRSMNDQGNLVNLKSSPIRLLINYNTEREKIEFNKKIFTCNICFTDYLGIECARFDACNHVFCKDCVSSYFSVQINDGNVQQITCPENKCSSEATHLQIKELVSTDLYTKYDSLLLKQALDSLEHVIYCPRKFCQYPATLDNGEHLAICPNCQYVFCIFCKMVYHGVEPCKINSEERRKLMERYLNASEEGKKEMEISYGAKQLQTMVSNTMAETWIESNCKSCPHCKVPIEKSNGCNKMACGKCGIYFCWLCSEVLDRSNPYSHYSSSSSCAQKLFYLTPLDPDEELNDYNSDDEQWHDWDWV